MILHIAVAFVFINIAQTVRDKIFLKIPQEQRLWDDSNILGSNMATAHPLSSGTCEYKHFFL